MKQTCHTGTSVLWRRAVPNRAAGWQSCKANALKAPLRELNALLLAAGFAPLYREATLDAPEFASVRRATRTCASRTLSRRVG